jgi:transposase-like protein
MVNRMKKIKPKLEIRTARYFSEEFKRSKVKELIEKQITVTRLSRLYGVTRSAVYKWLYQYSGYYKQKTNLVVQMESESYKTQRLQQQVAEMERTIGQKQLEIDFLNKLFEIASEEVGYDLKKNFSPRLSSGTAANEKNTPTK